MPPSWPRVALRMALCGATVGTLLDGIHSAVALQVGALCAAGIKLATPAAGSALAHHALRA